MKTIDELGISPVPWSVNLKHPGYVLNADENVVVKELSGMDARLIAAAPELYQSLCEGIKECCGECQSYMESKGHGCNDGSSECIVQRWRRAIAKASGEEMK